MTDIDLSRRQIAKAGLGAVALLAFAKIANAGECPKDKTTLDGSGQKAGATMPKGVVDQVIAMIPLSEETEVGAADRVFRLRRLEIQPGGEVPWHSHADRPAIIYVVQGSVTEYRNTCEVPVIHAAGTAIPENHLVSHWWRNTGNDVAILLSADLLHLADPNVHMM